MANDNKKNNNKTASKPAAANTTPQSNDTSKPAFSALNYILMAAGIFVLIVGYILLSGGGSDDPNVFNEAMFDNRRLVWAPLMLVAGLVVEICGIMYRKKN